MAKEKITDGYEITVALSGYSQVSIERALAAIFEELGPVPPVEGYKATLKCKGGAWLAERIEQAERRLRARKGVEAEIKLTRIKLIEPDAGATFWDLAAAQAEEQAERAADRRSGISEITMSGGGKSVTLSAEEFDRAADAMASGRFSPWSPDDPQAA